MMHSPSPPLSPQALPPVSTPAHYTRLFALMIAGIGLCMIPWSLAYWRTGVDLGIGLIGTGFLLHCTLTRHWEWLKQPLGIGLIIWLIWMAGIVSPFAAKNPLYSFTYSLAWLRYPLVFIAIIQWLLPDPVWRKRIWISFALATAVIILETIVQWLTGTSISGHPAVSGRLTGPFRSPKVGVLMIKCSIALLALTLLMRPQWLTHKRRITLIGAAVIGIIILVVATGERMMAILTLSSAVLVILLSCLYYSACRRASALLLATMTGGVLALLQWNSYVQERTELLFAQLHHFSHTEYASLYESALKMWQSSPVTGVGLRHYRDLCPDFIDASLAHYCKYFIHPHNFAIEWLAESGLPGLLLFYALIALCLYPVLRWLKERNLNETKPAFASACLVIAIGWINFFPIVASQGNWNNWNAGLSWVAFAITVGAWKLLAQTKAAEQPRAS